MKTCKQCGETKPLEEFRHYYNSKHQYSFCKSCEAIMQSYKHLKKIVDRNEAQEEKLRKIELLYKYRQEAGLSIPGKPTKVTDVERLVDSLLSKAEKGEQK